MRFHYTILAFVTIVLFCAGAASAGDFERQMAAQLDRQVDQQVSALVSQSLARQVEALHVPSALPKPSPVRHASPVASATSARALPGGELATAQLVCVAGDDCRLVPKGESALLAVKGR